MKLEIGPIIVTPWRSPEDGSHAIGCPLCRRWSEISTGQLGSELACPHCQGRLEVNPFTVTADWRALARAWAPQATAKTATGTPGSILDEDSSAPRSMLNELVEWSRFIRAEGYVMRERPHLFFQQAANQAGESWVAKRAAAHWEAGAVRRPWLRWINKPQFASPLRLTIAHAWPPMAWSPDGRRLVTNYLRRGSREPECTLKIWDTESGAELATLAGHEHQVTHCAFAFDGRRILSSSRDHTLKIWDAESGAELASLAGHKDEVWGCVYSPDGRRVLSWSWDHTLKVWDAEDGTELATIAFPGPPSAWALSPDGCRLACAFWCSYARRRLPFLRAWEACHLVGLLPSPSRPRRLPPTFTIWDVESRAELVTFEGHKDDINQCAFSPDGKSILSASSDGTLKVWDVETGVLLATFTGHEGAVHRCTFSPDGRRIVSASGDTLKVWDTTTATELATLVGHISSIKTCSFSPDGQRILSASGDGTARLWDARSGQELATLSGHTRGVHASFLPDGQRIVTASHTVRLWDADRLVQEPTQTQRVSKWGFSPDGRLLVVSSGRDRGKYMVKLLDGETGTVTTVAEETDAVADYSFSRDGCLLLILFVAPGVNKRYSLHLFDGRGVVSGRCHVCRSVNKRYSLQLFDGRELRTVLVHTGWVGNIAFSDDGAHIAFEFRDLDGHISHSVRRALQGKYVEDWGYPLRRRNYTPSQKIHLKVLETQSGVEVKTARETPQTGEVRRARPGPTSRALDQRTWLTAWGEMAGTRLQSRSPDGRLTLSLSDDEILELRDAETGAKLCEYEEAAWPHRSCKWSPDGRRFGVKSRRGGRGILLLEPLNLAHAERERREASDLSDEKAAGP